MKLIYIILIIAIVLLISKIFGDYEQMQQVENFQSVPEIHSEGVKF